MANVNPILLDQLPATATNYDIPAKYADTMIYLTIKIELKQKKWQYVSLNTIILRGKDKFPQKTPEPTDLKLDYANNLQGSKCFVSTHVSRIRNDADNDTPAIVKYTILIEAGDNLLDAFTKESDTNNPSNFNSLIQFNLLQ